ncbi:MAG: polysaccharide deacetylase family protein [Kiritimatiellaeota bacterium]|nr:polysaccharide deacetylase family protein [Kiritimatiellota bacterium]
MSKTPRKIFRNVLIVIVVAVALTAGARIRARLLPDVEVPVLLYERVENTPSDGKYSVGADLFYAQLLDLSRRGYSTVAPWRLRAYKRWGVPLPEKPLIITFDRPCRDLPAVAGQALDDRGFTAVALLPTSYITNEALKRRQTLEGAEMMTWEEVRKTAKEGVFSFGGHTRSRADLTLSEQPLIEIRASRSDIKKNLGVRANVFSYPFGKITPEIRKAAKRVKYRIAFTYGDTIAVIGPKTDLLALPRIRVVGGRQSFSVEANESRSRENFGFATVKRESGPSFPMSVSVFYGADPNPVATNITGAGNDDALDIPLPYPASGIQSGMYPIRVEIRDATGILFYLSTELSPSSVKRASSAPVDIPGEFDLGELEF